MGFQFFLKKQMVFHGLPYRFSWLPSATPLPSPQIITSTTLDIMESLGSRRLARLSWLAVWAGSQAPPPCQGPKSSLPQHGTHHGIARFWTACCVELAGRLGWLPCATPLPAPQIITSTSWGTSWNRSVLDGLLD